MKQDDKDTEEVMDRHRNQERGGHLWEQNGQTEENLEEKGEDGGEVIV